MVFLFARLPLKPFLCGSRVMFSVTSKRRASHPCPKPATRIWSPGVASSRAETSISRGWATPVSPHSSCRLPITFFESAPSFLAIFLCSALKKQGKTNLSTCSMVIPSLSISPFTASGMIFEYPSSLAQRSSQT